MSLCACFQEVKGKLEPHGLRLSQKLFLFSVSGLNLDLNFHLPLERIDGKKLTRADAKTIRVAHCPFCGAVLAIKGIKKGRK